MYELNQGILQCVTGGGISSQNTSFLDSPITLRITRDVALTELVAVVTHLDHESEQRREVKITFLGEDRIRLSVGSGYINLALLDASAISSALSLSLACGKIIDMTLEMKKLVDSTHLGTQHLLRPGHENGCLLRKCEATSMLFAISPNPDSVFEGESKVYMEVHTQEVILRSREDSTMLLRLDLEEQLTLAAIMSALITKKVA